MDLCRIGRPRERRQVLSILVVLQPTREAGRTIRYHVGLAHDRLAINV